MAKNAKRSGMFDDLDPSKKEYTDTHTPTPTVVEPVAPTYTPAHATDRRVDERKTERLQLLVRPSTKVRLVAYAKAHNTSSNEVVQHLLDKLLDDTGY